MMKKDCPDKRMAESAGEERRKGIVAPAPEEAARLIRAFVAVKDPQMRRAILAFVENLA